MAAKRKDTDLSLLKIDPAAYGMEAEEQDSKQAEEQEENKKSKEGKQPKDYKRVNIFVPKESVPIYKDFQLFAQDSGVSTSALLVSFMEKTVAANREAIEEARQRFEIRAKSKPF